MLKLPKGLKKKKKKGKKDQDLFTEEELEEYKRQQKNKQEAVTSKSDAGESNSVLYVEGLASTVTEDSSLDSASVKVNDNSKETNINEVKDLDEVDDEWAKFKALTSGVDSILHKTQDELDRIKKESFYQRVPTAFEKKRVEEAEAVQKDDELAEKENDKTAHLESQCDKLIEAVVELSEAVQKDDELAEKENDKTAHLESQCDKLIEAVVELSELEEDEEVEVDDIFVTDFIDAITSGEVKLSIVPDSPVFENTGPDPFDTAYAEKVITGADKAKDKKKLVPLGAAVEVLSGRVEREKALELAKPKRKLRKGIKNLLLSESIDLAEQTEDLQAPEPQANLFDELVNDVPELSTPIDLSVSLHLNFIQEKKSKPDDETKESTVDPRLVEFDDLKIQDDDEFAEIAAESINKKDKAIVITEVSLPKVVSADWAEFEQEFCDDQSTTVQISEKQTISDTGLHFGSEDTYIQKEESDCQTEDYFNTTYVDHIIKRTTVLEEDEDFDPRAEEKPEVTESFSFSLKSNLSQSAKNSSNEVNFGNASTHQINIDSNIFASFDIAKIVSRGQLKGTELTPVESQLDSDFSTTEDKIKSGVIADKPSFTNFDLASRKSSLRLNIQPKSVAFLVPDQNILGIDECANNKKPLTPFYASDAPSFVEKDIEDPFDTSFVPEVKPTAIELKHLEDDLLAKHTIKQSLSDPDFNPRAPSTPIPAEDLLTVKEEISAKVLTPAQENKKLLNEQECILDPFDTSIASNIKPGRTELKLLESELLPSLQSVTHTGVLDIQSDAQELGLGDKVLTPLLPHKQIEVLEEVDPFDTSIAENLGPGEIEIKLLESELIDH